MKLGIKKGLVLTLVGCAVLSLGFGALIYFSFSKIEEEQALIEQKKTDLKTAKEKEAQIAGLEKKVILLRENVQEYLKTLPNSKEVVDFVRKVYTFQDEAGVGLTEIGDNSSKDRSTAANKPDAGFEKIGYHWKLDANLWEFLNFIHRLESYERFVRITKIKIEAGKRSKDSDPTKVKHEFEIDAETYLFNPTAAAKPADIKQYESRVTDLKEEILRARDKIVAEPYDYHGPRGRRDPFLDPRMQVSEEGGGEEALKHQMEIVDQLRAEVAKIGQMALEYGQTTPMIRRFDLRREIEKSTQALLEQVERIEKEGRITYLPLVRRIQRDVIDAVSEIRRRFDPKSVSDSGPSREELEEIAVRIREHLSEGEFTIAMDRFTLIADRLKLVEKDPARQELVAELRRLNRQAEVAQEFGKKKIQVEGLIVSEQGSVVVINGKSFGEGDYIDDELMIRAIHSDAIEFQYQDVVINKKI